MFVGCLFRFPPATAVLNIKTNSPTLMRAYNEISGWGCWFRRPSWTCGRQKGTLFVLSLTQQIKLTKAIATIRFVWNIDYYFLQTKSFVIRGYVGLLGALICFHNVAIKPTILHLITGGLDQSNLDSYHSVDRDGCCRGPVCNCNSCRRKS